MPTNTEILSVAHTATKPFDARRQKKAVADAARWARATDETRQKDRERALARYHARDKNDPVKTLKRRSYLQAYVKANSAKYQDYVAQRRFFRVRGCLPKLRRELKPQIEAIYAECARLTLATGIRHEVDHIVPLNHPDVCGLHVPWNLGILTATENRVKGNRLICEDRAW